MSKKILVSTTLLVLLAIGILGTTVLASDLKLANNTNLVEASLTTPESVVNKPDISIREVSIEEDDVVKPEITEENKLENINIDEIMEKVPETYEEVETEVLPLPTRTRFLLYTHDGKHIMWGYVGNGRFFGQDNLGKRCWGIYGKNFFAGFYDGEIFWGRYRSGQWKAVYLFGERYSHGEYILFSTISLEPSIASIVP
jgi:hypothetical protein